MPTTRSPSPRRYRVSVVSSVRQIIRFGYDIPPSSFGLRRDRLCQREVCEHVTISLDNAAEIGWYWVVEHRAREGEGMELAVLAAGVDRRRQVRQQRPIEHASRKRAVQLSRVDAGEPGLQPRGDHLVRQFARGFCLPQREQRLEAGAGKPGFAVAAHVFEKQIA